MTAQLDIFDDTASVLALIAADPNHSRDIAAVVQAITQDAAAHGGRVDSNRVRDLIPTWVHKRAVGAAYSSLRRRGLLVADGWTTSTDTAGRNAHKPCRLYRFRTVVGEKSLAEIGLAPTAEAVAS